MRVLLVSNHGADRSYGGAERYVSDLAAALSERGHDVRLLSAFPVRDGSAARTVTLHATDWREDRARRLRNHLDDWRAADGHRLEAVLEGLAPELVHTSNLPGISTGIWAAARRLGVPVVHTLHDYHLLCPRTSLTRPDGTPCQPHPLLCGLRTRRLSHWADAVGTVIGVSSHVLGRHAGFFPTTTARRVVLPPLVPPPGRPGPYAVPAGARTLGYVGALAGIKGIEVLLEAARRLATRGVRVRVAGDGPLRRQVSDEPAVDYVGRLEPGDLAEFMAGCDLGVVPSLWEEPGVTYALFEWLACGRPAVTTRRGGLAEAAALGGVENFDGTVDGLLDVVTRLSDPARWTALLQALPHPDPQAEIRRWTDQHLAAYAAAQP
jgi:glycogen(starch) synthase